jgi:hypothetical protein
MIARHLSLIALFILINQSIKAQNYWIVQLGSGTEFGYNKSPLQNDLSTLYKTDIKFNDKNYFLPSFDVMRVASGLAFAGLSFNGVNRSWQSTGVTKNDNGTEQAYIINGNYNMCGGIKLGIGYHNPDTDKENFERKWHGLFFYLAEGVAKNGMKLYNRSDAPFEYKELALAPWTYNEYKTIKNYFGIGTMIYVGYVCADLEVKRFSNSYWYDKDGLNAHSLRSGGYWLSSVSLKISFASQPKEKE